MTAPSTIKVASGRRGIVSDCRVLMNGHDVGSIGEEIESIPGNVVVSVKSAPYTCNPVSIDLKSGMRVLLEYRPGLLAYLVLLISIPVFGSIFLLLLHYLSDDLGFAVFLAAIVLAGIAANLALGAPLRLIALLRVRTHSLQVVKSEPSQRIL